MFSPGIGKSLPTRQERVSDKALGASGRHKCRLAKIRPCGSGIPRCKGFPVPGLADRLSARQKTAAWAFTREPVCEPQNGDCHQFPPLELDGCPRFAPGATRPDGIRDEGMTFPPPSSSGGRNRYRRLTRAKTARRWFVRCSSSDGIIMEGRGGRVLTRLSSAGNEAARFTPASWHACHA